MAIDYSRYSYYDLKEISRSIDRLNYPDNYKALVREINLRKEKGEHLVPDDRDNEFPDSLKILYFRRPDYPQLIFIDQVFKLIMYALPFCLLLIYIYYWFSLSWIDGVVIFGVLFFIRFVPGILEMIKLYLPRRCPVCRRRMKRLKAGDNNIKYYACHQCKCYIEAGITIYVDLKNLFFK